MKDRTSSVRKHKNGNSETLARKLIFCYLGLSLCEGEGPANERSTLYGGKSLRTRLGYHKYLATHLFHLVQSKRSNVN